MSKSRLIVGLLCVLPVFLATQHMAQAYQALATARAVVPPTAPYPGYLQTVTDAAFGTPFTRMTDPGRQMLPGIFCKPTYCTHHVGISKASHQRINC
jgi:hypothetical protein